MTIEEDLRQTEAFSSCLLAKKIWVYDRDSQNEYCFFYKTDAKVFRKWSDQVCKLIHIFNRNNFLKFFNVTYIIYTPLLNIALSSILI